MGILSSFQKQRICKIYLQALFLPMLSDNSIFYYNLRHAKLVLSIPKGLNIVIEPTFVKIVYVLCFTENKVVNSPIFMLNTDGLNDIP